MQELGLLVTAMLWRTPPHFPNTPVLPPCGCNVFDRDFGIDFEKSVFYFLMLICLIFNTGFTLFKTQKKHVACSWAISCKGSQKWTKRADLSDLITKTWNNVAVYPPWSIIPST